MWEYYYDAESDETTYYHQEEEVATLNGRGTMWRNGLPHGDHLEDIRDVFQEAGTPDRIAMTYDLHLGFDELDEPYLDVVSR